MPATYKILIMGASYGSLLASKILYGGHSVHLVCLPAEADLKPGELVYIGWFPTSPAAATSGDEPRPSARN